MTTRIYSSTGSNASVTRASIQVKGLSGKALAQYWEAQFVKSTQTAAKDGKVSASEASQLSTLARNAAAAQVFAANPTAQVVTARDQYVVERDEKGKIWGWYDGTPAASQGKPWPVIPEGDVTQEDLKRGATLQAGNALYRIKPGDTLEGISRSLLSSCLATRCSPTMFHDVFGAPGTAHAGTDLATLKEGQRFAWQKSATAMKKWDELMIRHGGNLEKVVAEFTTTWECKRFCIDPWLARAENQPKVLAVQNTLAGINDLSNPDVIMAGSRLDLPAVEALAAIVVG